MAKWNKLEVNTTEDNIAKLLGMGYEQHYSIYQGDVADEDGNIQVFGTELADRIVALLNADDADAELTAPSAELQQAEDNLNLWQQINGTT